MSNKFQFQADKFYHIYNRGVEKRNIYIDNYDYVRFIRSMREFNEVEPIGSLYRKDYIRQGLHKGVRHPIGCRTPKPQLVELIAYCLNYNHFHFILRQRRESGVSGFIKRLSGGYTNYFNHKNNRSGVLFQGSYKAIEINSYSHFLKLTVYVNCNSEVHKIASADKWIWSSYLDYINERNGTLCNKEVILNEFSHSLEFKNFCRQALPEIIKNKEMKVLLLE